MRTLLITLLTCIITLPVLALDLEKAVRMLEAAEDFETAEPIAFKLSQKMDEHYYRIEFLRKYPASDFAEIVYQQAWRDTKDAGNVAKLQSFVKVKPKGQYSLRALETLFELYQQENTLLAYQEYLREFPNSPKAVDALEGIFSLAFKRATEYADKQQSIKFFDEYIRTFPTSPHREEANKKAETMQRRAYKQQLDEFSIGKLFSSKQDQKESIAREIYNQMRFWQKQDQSLIAQRKYNLLQDETFRNTKAYTEMLDRQETQAFRDSLTSHQQQTRQQLDDLNRVYEQESQRIVASIQAEASSTRKTIAQEGDTTRQVITGQAEASRQSMADEGVKTRREINLMTSQVSDLTYQKGRLADAVNQQTDRMMEEARRASYEQQQMLGKAKEESRQQARRSRHCAEVLTKNGKYPFLSGCP